MRNIKRFTEFVFEGLSGLTKSALDAVTLENPPGSNKGDKVEAMQRSVGISPGDPWCAAFVYSIFKNANLDPAIMRRIPKTGGVNKMWQSATNAKKITKEEALKNPELILPGMVFFYLTKNDKGQYPGTGHTGMVIKVDKNNKTITSIEGNTNPFDGAREGFGSFVITRKIEDPSISKDPKLHPSKMLGFIDFLDGYRNPEDLEYSKFIKSLGKIELAYRNQTIEEIWKIQKFPGILDQYALNYENRDK
jgi:hypothetical protein